MRLEIKVVSDKIISLPSSHNHIIQGLVYSLMEASLRRKIHEQGFRFEKRAFRLFTFSRLYGKFERKNAEFSFYPPVKLFISSSRRDILQSIAENLVKLDKFYLGDNEVFIESINVLPIPDFSGKITIKMLSPLTCYSTLKKGDGSRKTYYYSPFEEEFATLVKENLQKKYKVVFGDIKDFDFGIKPRKVLPQDQKIIIYNRSRTDRGTVIKAWMGIYQLWGSKKALELAYDVGLGAKNSQGFGCWERLKDGANA